MKKMENYLLILSIIYIIFEVIVLSFPYKLIFRRRGSLSACKTNMKAIAWALDMYSGRNGFYPDPYINRHPASEEGILVKQGYIKSTINDPLAHWDYIYIYNSDRHIYEILCPNPEMYRYSKHDYLKRLKFESEKGIVTDPEGK
ncbi:hypothetical protein KAU32_01755 [bacterium]|nr:hypothetical protein [bacterium]